MVQKLKKQAKYKITRTAGILALAGIFLIIAGIADQLIFDWQESRGDPDFSVTLYPSQEDEPERKKATIPVTGIWRLNITCYRSEEYYFISPVTININETPICFEDYVIYVSRERKTARIFLKRGDVIEVSALKSDMFCDIKIHLYYLPAVGTKTDQQPAWVRLLKLGVYLFPLTGVFLIFLCFVHIVIMTRNSKEGIKAPALHEPVPEKDEAAVVANLRLAREKLKLELKRRQRLLEHQGKTWIIIGLSVLFINFIFSMILKPFLCHDYIRQTRMDTVVSIFILLFIIFVAVTTLKTKKYADRGILLVLFPVAILYYKYLVYYTNENYPFTLDELVTLIIYTVMYLSLVFSSSAAGARLIFPRTRMLAWIGSISSAIKCIFPLIIGIFAVVSLIISESFSTFFGLFGLATAIVMIMSATNSIFNSADRPPEVTRKRARGAIVLDVIWLSLSFIWINLLITGYDMPFDYSYMLYAESWIWVLIGAGIVMSAGMTNLLSAGAYKKWKRLVNAELVRIDAEIAADADDVVH